MANYPVGVTIEQAASLLLEQIQSVQIEKIPIRNSFGRILAEEIYAEENIPPFDRSPYDGYALRSEDVKSASPESPVQLNIIEEVPAGHTASRSIRSGEAVKILTGAPIPAGADVVVKYEDTNYTDQYVDIFKPCRSGSNIVRAGEDVKAGEHIIGAGDTITSAVAGLLAGLGHAYVDVHRKPRVVLISTGDELLEADEALEPGKIRNSSAYMLTGFLEERGIDVDLYGIVEDKLELITEAIRESIKSADLVFTTGGASVGDYDFVLDALERLSADILFWKVKMKPGMATLAAICEGVPVVGLSGNPSAAAAAMFLVAMPALEKLCGKREQRMTCIKVCLKGGFERKSPMGRFLPGVLEFAEGKVWLNTRKDQANGMVSPWGSCNLIGMIPQGSPPLPPGAVIDAWYLG